MEPLKHDRKQINLPVTPPFTPETLKDSTLEDATNSYDNFVTSSDEEESLDDKERVLAKGIASPLSDASELPPRGPSRSPETRLRHTGKLRPRILVESPASQATQPLLNDSPIHDQPSFEYGANIYSIYTLNIRSALDSVSSSLVTVYSFIASVDVTNLLDTLRDVSYTLIPFISIFFLYVIWTLHYVLLFVSMAIKLLVIVAFDSVSIACAQLAHHVHTLDPRIVDRSSALGLDLDLLTRFGPEYAGRLKRGSSRTKTKQKKTRRLSPVAAVRASSFSDMDDSLSDYNESEPLVPEVLGEPLYNSPASIEAPLPAAAADEHPASPPNEVRDEGAVAARTSPEVDPHFVRLMEKLVASGKRQGEGVPAQSTLDAKKIAPLPRRARLATGGKQKQHGQAPEVPEGQDKEDITDALQLPPPKADEPVTSTIPATDANAGLGHKRSREDDATPAQLDKTESAQFPTLSSSLCVQPSQSLDASRAEEPLGNGQHGPGPAADATQAPAAPPALAHARASHPHSAHLLSSNEVLTHPIVKEKRWRILGKLGEGHFGRVYCAAMGLGYEPSVAIKQVSKAEYMAMHRSLEYLHKEIEVLMMTTRQSSSLLLQAMWCSFEDPTSVFIVMPLQRCSLRDRLAMSKDTPITPGDQILYMAEMVQALEDLHALNIVHRDLKPDNFLLNKKGHVVLSDFGVAHQFGHSHRSMWKLGGAAGDFYYMAPEMHPISPPGDPVVKFGSYDERADIWSLGLTFLQMALGLKKNFFIAIMEQDGGSRHVEGPPSFEAIQGALCGLQDSYLHNLLVWMLRKDPESRPSLTKVKHHDYFHNVNWEQVKSHSFGDPSFKPVLQFETTKESKPLPSETELHDAAGHPVRERVDCPIFSPMNYDMFPAVDGGSIQA